MGVQFTTGLQTVTFRISDFPTFTDGGRTWKITEIVGNYYPANYWAAEAGSFWTAKATLVKKDGTMSDTVFRRVGSSWGTSPEIRKLVTEFVRENDPRNAVNERDMKLAEVRRKHDAFVSRVAAGMPECWGDTEEDVAEFVESLTNGTTTTPGHSMDCDCFG